MTMLFFRKNGDAVEATTIEGELVLRWPLSDKRCFTEYICMRELRVCVSGSLVEGVVRDVDLDKLHAKMPPGWRPLRPTLWQRIKSHFAGTY